MLSAQIQIARHTARVRRWLPAVLAGLALVAGGTVLAQDAGTGAVAGESGVDASLPASADPVDTSAAAPDSAADETAAVEPADAAAVEDDGGGEAPAPADDQALIVAELAPLAARSLLLDIDESDQRAIVVGERGHVLVSESRQDWRQVEGVPTRSTLTAVATVGNHAWAVGHAQVVLHSADGGLSWQRQHADPYDPDDFDDIANGAPLLDVLFLDERRGLAIGAYGLLLRTADGGATWERGSVSTGAATQAADVAAAAPAGDDAAADDAAGADDEDDSWTFSDDELALEELSDPHLNAVARTGSGGLLIVAERGSAFRSRDDGATWERLSIPYDGSMFGAIGYAGDRVLVFGLRGNVFETRDLGDTWTAVDTGTEQTLQGGAALDEDGGAVLVGSNGVVLVRRDGNEPFRQFTTAEGGVLADVLPVGGPSSLVVVGENGIGRFGPN